jgi:hypothetical protein
MPFLTNLLTKAKNLAAAATGFIKNLTLRERVIFAGLGFAFIFLVFAGMFLLANKTRQRRVDPLPPAAERIVIPPEELFLPEEPDFVPGILLERERRTSWTAADAEPHWQDPLRNGEEQWRDQAEAIIDELMERVP